MKLRILMADYNTEYLERLVSYLNRKHANDLDIAIYDNVESFQHGLEYEKFNMVIVDQDFDVELDDIEKNVVKVYFVNDRSNTEFKGHQTIHKYQKLNDIYNSIVSIYEEQSKYLKKINYNGGGEGNIISFVGVGTASGSSTVALATTRALASRGKQVFYLNLEQFPALSLYFGEETSDKSLSDVLYAITSGDSQEIREAIRESIQVTEGFQYFNAVECTIDLLDLEANELEMLLEEITRVTRCDYIVIDIDFMNCPMFFKVLDDSYKIIVTNDGSRMGNKKYMQFVRIMKYLEDRNGMNLEGKLNVFYNRFSNKTSSKAVVAEIQELGGCVQVKNASYHEVVDYMVNESNALENIIMECENVL